MYAAALALAIVSQAAAAPPAIPQLDAGEKVARTETEKPAPKPTAQQLFNAINGNNAGKVNEILEQNPKLVSAVDNPSNKRTPLHYAVQQRRTPIVKSLLKAGADVDTKDGYSYTPLHLAVMSRSAEVLDLLLAEEPKLDAKDNGQRAPLTYAVQYSFDAGVDKLIKAGADVNTKDNYDRTPLQYAVMYGRPDVAQKLLAQEEIDVTIADKGGYSPIWFAVQRGQAIQNNPKEKAVFEALIKKGAKLDGLNTAKQSLLHAAAMSGSADVLKMIMDKASLDVNAVDQQGATPLVYGVQSGSDPVVMALLEAGADPNKQGKKVYATPLMLASANGRMMTVAALLKKKADPNATGQLGNTALHSAAQANSAEVIKLLLAAGADPNQRNDQKQTPVAVAAAGEKFAAVNVLFPVSESVEIGPKGDGSLLHWAARHGLDQVIPLILEREDVDPNKLGDGKKTPLFIAAEQGHAGAVASLLKDKRVKPNAKRPGGETALHAAVWSNAPTAAVTLIKGNADVNVADDSGSTPLHAACWNGNAPLVTELLTAGAKQTATKSGSTPLHGAAWAGHTAVAVLLIEHGADVNAKDSDGQTPLHKASYQNQSGIANLLIRSGADKSLKDASGFAPQVYEEVPTTNVPQAPAVKLDVVPGSTGAPIPVP